MLDYTLLPIPTVETPRLIMRAPRPEDAAEFLIMRSDPEVMRYIPRPLAKSEQDILDLFQLMAGFTEKNEKINWVIEWKETGAAIGFIGYVALKPAHHRGEIGYSLSRAWHRRGIMREALAAMISWGFESLGLHSIEAILDADNAASEGILKDAGFRKEAHHLQDFMHNGEYRNTLIYGLLRSEWEQRSAAALVRLRSR